jgi:hypothetical protein
MSKVPMKYDQGNVASTIDQLFEIAMDKMESDKDKTVLMRGEKSRVDHKSLIGS